MNKEDQIKNIRNSIGIINLQLELIEVSLKQLLKDDTE